MKVGDIVKVHDGSYSLSLVKGVMRNTYSIAFQERQFRVHGISGMYPTHRSNEPHSGDNDILLVDVNDSDFVLFSQERFCSVVTPLRKTTPPVQFKVGIPRGTDEIHLIFT